MTPTDRAAMAYKLVRSDLGRRAADERWLSELWDFVFAYGAEPSEAEISELRRKAKRKWKDLPDWPFPSAQKAIINKFEKLKRQAYGCKGADG